MTNAAAVSEIGDNEKTPFGGDGTADTQGVTRASVLQ
jgi:hypothetical protein